MALLLSGIKITVARPKKVAALESLVADSHPAGGRSRLSPFVRGESSRLEFGLPLPVGKCGLNELI